MELGPLVSLGCLGFFFWLGWWFLSHSLYSTPKGFDDRDNPVEVRPGVLVQWQCTLRCWS
jgi:hypothetical protein